MRFVLRLISVLVPAGARPRWREQWLAELQCVSSARGRRRALAVALGAVPDAIAARRIASAGLPRASLFHALDQDLRYALRGLLKAPGFAGGVVVSLALGIGATTAAFSFINAAVFRPFPAVTHQAELVRITLGSVAEQRFSPARLTYQDFITMRAAIGGLEGLSASQDVPFAIFAHGQASVVSGALVSGNYFDVLGVTPAAGRFFLEREDRTAWRHPVVVISDALWDRLYDRNPSTIGRTLVVNGAPLEIVGVTPRHFMGVKKRDLRPAVWVPMAMAELALRDGDGKPARIENAGGLFLDYVGRRRAGSTIAQVDAQAAALGDNLEAARQDGRRRLTVSRVWINDPVEAAPAILGFMAIPMLVLAIACVNAANLVLARSSRRVRDWTVRLAVGATRWRIVRQLLVEALLLSLAATALGLGVTRWILSMFAAQAPVPMPLDYRVALFTIAIAGVTAVTFSLGPALGVTARATRRLVSASAASGGPARSRTRFVLVSVQAALSLGLLATGTQFTKTVYSSVTQPHIPDPQQLVITSVDVDPLRMNREAGQDYFRRLLERARTVPGVAAAGLSTPGLLNGLMGRNSSLRIWTPDSPAAGHGILGFQVSAGCLDAIAVRLLQGRRFTAADDGLLRSVIINKPFADRFLQGRGVGSTFRLAAARDTVAGAPLGPAPDTLSSATEVTVIGVVGGMTKRDDLEPALVYYPAPLSFRPARTLYLRLDRTATFTAAALQTAVSEVDPRVPMGDASTLEQIWQRQNSEWLFVMRAVAILGILGLALAGGGLSSVVAYVVSLRRQEVGIRVALGADTATIVTMIVRQALAPTLVGAAVGAGCAAAAGAIIKSRVYGAASVDPIAFVAALVLMLAAMLLASWIPARHAGRVDPVSVLRQE
jgi:putative ABC transport system permease protein